MNIQTYHIETSMGRAVYHHEVAKLASFLSPAEIEEFNLIGYTGKNSAGKASTYEKYLNTLNKGKFKVETLAWDGGEYTAKYNIIRVVSKGK